MINHSINILKLYFKNKIEISDDEFEYWKSFFIYKEVKKNKFLLTEEDICRHIFFVTSGCLRSFTIDKNGNDHIIQFAPENWWISDLNSFSNEVPSLISIDAVIDSTVLKIEREYYNKLSNESSKWSNLFLSLLQNSRGAYERRILSYLNSSAEERYLNFMNHFSAIASQIPQHMIASYLGITPESLSRIRRILSDKK